MMATTIISSISVKPATKRPCGDTAGSPFALTNMTFSDLKVILAAHAAATASA